MTPSRAPFLPLVGVFGDPDIAELLGERAAIESWLEVERALAVAQASLGIVPEEAAAQIEAEAHADRVDSTRLEEGTRLVGYPILPLLDELSLHAAAGVGATIHRGATTQDIMDTGLALILRAALTRIDILLVDVGDLVAGHADRNRDTVMAARTHGQPAVPTTFGAKAAVWLAEFGRHRDRLLAARQRAEVLSLFGAGGTSAAFGPQTPRLRQLVGDRLGLRVVDVPWHTARDALAEVGFVLAAIAATCGKIAREVIDLSRPEIGELRESGGYRRGASSAMPQKENPIASEVVVGMSSLAAQQVPALLAAMQAGHERAAGEWQIEWDALPTVVSLGAGSLLNTRDILAGLSVFPDRMLENLQVDDGTIMAEAVMVRLAPLLGRARAHDLVHDACVVARDRGTGLRAALVQTLPADLLGALGSLDDLLEPRTYLGETNVIVDAAIEIWRIARHGAAGPPETGTHRDRSLAMSKGERG